MSIIDFLERHFEARGGKIAHNAYWDRLRWQPNEAEINAGHTTLVDVYNTASNHKSAFKKLKPQATLGDVLGMVTLSFTFTRKENPEYTKLLQGVSSDSKDYIDKQGRGLTFKRLMNAKVDILSPVEWLSLLSRSANPQDYSTYPAPSFMAGEGITNIEFLGGICYLDYYSAATVSGVNGACLMNLGPYNTTEQSRARSVLRGTPEI